MKLKLHMIAIASATLLASGFTTAQTAANSTMTPSATQQPRDGYAPANRERAAAMKIDKEQLEQKLRAGQSRADYAKILESNGFKIAHINADKPDYLEYEVVKGDRSFEVQMDFDKGSAIATKVDVANNLWRADATKRMMADANYKVPGTMVADADGRFSDRKYMQGWTDEKERLQRALPANMKVADYKPKIEQMGYKVTAVNDREKDYVEYEIAKGENSYEVQIDVDPATGRAKDVDVASNLWEAEATDRATDKASNNMAVNK